MSDLVKDIVDMCLKEDLQKVLRRTTELKEQGPFDLGAPDAAMRIRGGDPKSFASRVMGAVRNAPGPIARIARAATPWTYAASVMYPWPAGRGEDEKARQAKFGKPAYNQHSTYLTKQQHSKEPATFQKDGSVGPDTSKFTGGKPAPAAAPSVRQSFSQAFRAARAAVKSGEDPNKAQFKWTNAKGVEGTYQAAMKKSQFVTPAKQIKTDTVTTAPKSSPAQVAEPKNDIKRQYGTPEDLANDINRAKSMPKVSPKIVSSTEPPAPTKTSYDMMYDRINSKFKRDMQSPPVSAPTQEPKAPEPQAPKPTSVTNLDGSGPRKLGIAVPTTPVRPDEPGRASYLKGAEDLSNAMKGKDPNDLVPKAAKIGRESMNESFVNVGSNKYRIV